MVSKFPIRTSDGPRTTFFQRHPLLRIVATAWLLASVVMLIATLLRPELYGNDRAGLAWLTPLYWLSFPLGHAGLMAGIWIRLELYLGPHFVPSAFAEGLYLWTVLSVLGYLQWFVLLPWISRKCWQLSNVLNR
jgi:hypothetical protein